jgi:hypothetical protein
MPEQQALSEGCNKKFKIIAGVFLCAGKDFVCHTKAEAMEEDMNHTAGTEDMAEGNLFLKKYLKA